MVTEFDAYAVLRALDDGAVLEQIQRDIQSRLSTLPPASPSQEQELRMYLGLLSEARRLRVLARCSALMDSGGHLESLRELHSLIAVDPSSEKEPRVARAMAIAMARQGDVEAALRLMKAAHAAIPEDVEVRTNLAILYAMTGMREEAIEIVRVCRESGVVLSDKVLGVHGSLLIELSGADSSPLCDSSENDNCVLVSNDADAVGLSALEIPSDAVLSEYYPAAIEFYPAERLLSPGPYPATVDPASRELHLRYGTYSILVQYIVLYNDVMGIYIYTYSRTSTVHSVLTWLYACSEADFEEVFELTKPEFAALPKWRQKRLKKIAHLF
jgi:hypothetical protein